MPDCEPLEINDSPRDLMNESELPVPMQALYRRIEALYAYIDEPDAEVCILLTTDDAIRELNKEWRNLDETTDVLSFPMREGEAPEIARQLPLGDIAISVPTAMRYVESCQHKARLEDEGPMLEQWSLLDELTFLVIHATLHLLGYDHAEDDEDKIMREKEKSWMCYLLQQEK
ncbi:MAG: rRNA maturation RNase YbeY [Proteobacteria bacterium]|nr:rRNA maturation RNase YbeY [Pseudomonadota bacterium]